MEIARTTHDALPAVRHAFHHRAPSACGLDRGLHRLGARVHGEDHILAGKRGELPAELAQKVVVECARGQGHTVELRLCRGDDLGMTVPEIERAVSGEHVEILPAVRVDDARALRPCDHDGFGRVIMRAISFGVCYDALGQTALFRSFRNGLLCLHTKNRPLRFPCTCSHAAAHIIAHNRTKVNRVSGFSY